MKLRPYVIVNEPVLINEETSIEKTIIVEPMNGEPTSGETMTRSIKTSADVLSDENITAEDLGINKQRLLPTSPYYPVKTIWRGFRSILTFNPVKKVELNLRYANEKLIEAKQVSEEGNKPEIVTKTLERYQKDLADISKIVERSSEEIKAGAENFADKMIDYSFKQQNLIDGIEKNLTSEQFERVNIVRENGLDYFSQTMTNLIEPEQMKERIINVIESQEGSNFKDFKNIEILKIIEERAPEQAKEAIQQARENTVQRLQDNMTNMVEGEGKKFKEYIENVGGNEIRHLEIINDFTREGMPEFLPQEMEIIRDKAMERIENKMQEFTNEEQKKEFLHHLEQGEMEDIKIIKELEDNLTPETFTIIQEKIDNQGNSTTLANPASEFCIKNGGKIEMRIDSQGGQFGICHLPDGTECEEWAFLKGECQEIEISDTICPKLKQPDCENGIIQGYDNDENGCPTILRCMGLGLREEEIPVRKDLPVQEKIMCQRICKNVGTRSEGWYDSCTGKLLEYADCDNHPTTDSDSNIPNTTTEERDSDLNNNLVCPSWAPPSPDWCKDGQQVSGGTDKNGCKLPPKCIYSVEDQPVPNYPSNRDGQICAQVITYAISGDICKAFPTPCDVPSGWQKVDGCPEKTPENIIDGGNQNPLPPTPEETNKTEMEMKQDLEQKENAGSLGDSNFLEKIKNIFVQ